MFQEVRLHIHFHLFLLFLKIPLSVVNVTERLPIEFFESEISLTSFTKLFAIAVDNTDEKRNTLNILIDFFI